MSMTQNLMNEYNVLKREPIFGVSNKQNKEVILDLRLKAPFEDLPSIPVDTKTMDKRYDKFVEQVQEQKFLVFMKDAKQYFNNEDLNIKEVQNPIIRARLENDLNLRIMNEKSGFKEVPELLNDTSKKSKNFEFSESFETPDLKVPIEKLFIKFEFKN